METDINYTRPLALLAFVSANIFNESQRPDFYLALAAFFEPFIKANDKKLLSLSELINFSEQNLSLILSDDIADLLIGRMASLGWLHVEAQTEGRKLFKCTYTGAVTNEEKNDDIDKEVGEIVSSFQNFLFNSDARATFENEKEVEENLLRFLAEHFLFRDSEFKRNPDRFSLEKSSKDHWIAKFISWVHLNAPKQFELLQKISGVLLLTDAILEIRQPTNADKVSELIVYVDGPLLMEHMGLSGLRSQENAKYVVEKLKKFGANVACFRHSCSEVRDNLNAVLLRPIEERTGPTAEALRRGEVQTALLHSVVQNVEHFVKQLTGFQILDGNLEQYKHNEKFCDQAVFSRLVLGMPSQTPIGRERDALSVAIIMRRRSGVAVSNLFGTRHIMITSNEALIQHANSILRKNGALSQDKSIIGPAIHHRLAAGVLFANVGSSEKKEVSRRQLLAVCSKVVVLRPRVLEKLREQIKLLNRPDEQIVVDALLNQPRATEVLMDNTVGAGRTVSSSNVDELIKVIKQTAANDERIKYQERSTNDRKKIEEESKVTLRKLQSEKSEVESALKTAHQKTSTTEKEVDNLVGHLNSLNTRILDLSDRVEKVDHQLKLTALLLAQNTLKMVARYEKYSMWLLVFIVWALLSVIPLTFSGNWMIWMLVIFGGFVNSVGTIFLIWNRKIVHVETYLGRFTERKILSQLSQMQLQESFSYLKIDYPNKSIVLRDDN